MKKLGKLSINPDKVIRKEELVNLRGGYNMCYSTSGFLGIIYAGACGGTSGLDECQDLWPNARTSVC